MSINPDGSTSTPLERAVEIGHEIRGIESAIEQGRDGFINERFTYPEGLKASAEDHRKVRVEYYESDLYKNLNARRRALRTMLLQLKWETP